MLVLMSLTYAHKLGRLNVQLIFDSCFVWMCFGSSSIFAYSKKWIKESVSNFVWKTKLSAWTHSECWLWHMVKLTWTLARHSGSPRPKKARQVRSNVKVLLRVFSDCRGVVHLEFLPQGRTVNKEYYLQVIRNLREAIRQKRPDLWKNKNWLLHHDNARAHTSLLVRKFLAKNNTLMMMQPPYSPDLAPCDFFLFPRLKRPMKGRRYATMRR